MPKFTALSESDTAACYGTNHRDAGHRVGTCDECGAEVAEHCETKRLMPISYRGEYRNRRTTCCWAIHTCNPEHVQRWAAAVARDLAEGVIRKGQHVAVIKGRKVPKGTTGVVVWLGESDWGPRVGFRPDDGGPTVFLAIGNVAATNTL